MVLEMVRIVLAVRRVFLKRGTKTCWDLPLSGSTEYSLVRAVREAQLQRIGHSNGCMLSGKVAPAWVVREQAGSGRALIRKASSTALLGYSQIDDTGR